MQIHVYMHIPLKTAARLRRVLAPLLLPLVACPGCPSSAHTCPLFFVTATRCCIVWKHQRLLNRFPINGSDVAEKPLVCQTVPQRTVFTRIFSYLPVYLGTNSLKKNDADSKRICHFASYCQIPLHRGSAILHPHQQCQENVCFPRDAPIKSVIQPLGF